MQRISNVYHKKRFSFQTFAQFFVTADALCSYQILRMKENQ